LRTIAQKAGEIGKRPIKKLIGLDKFPAKLGLELKVEKFQVRNLSQLRKVCGSFPGEVATQYNDKNRLNSDWSVNSSSDQHQQHQ